MRKSDFLCFEVEDLEHLLKLPPPPSSEGGQTKPALLIFNLPQLKKHLSLKLDPDGCNIKTHCSNHPKWKLVTGKLSDEHI